jgi:hypothetical protein
VRRLGNRQRGGQEQNLARRVVPQRGRGVNVVIVDAMGDPPGVRVVGQADAVDPPPSARGLDAAELGTTADILVVGLAADQVDLERISFVDALRWSSSLPGTPLPKLVVNPHRPGRVEPRCKKLRAKKHPYMIRPRHVLRQRLLDKQVPA